MRCFSNVLYVIFRGLSPLPGELLSVLTGIVIWDVINHSWNYRTPLPVRHAYHPDLIGRLQKIRAKVLRTSGKRNE